MKTFALSTFTALSIFAAAPAAFAFGAMQPIQEVFEPTGEFPTDRFWKVAVVQWNPELSTQVGVSPEEGERIKQLNREVMGQRVREAASKGAKYVTLSEFAVVGYPDIPELPSEEDEYRNRDDIAPYVEPANGPSTQFFSALAKELGVWIQFGFAEVDPATDAYYNTAVVVNDLGQTAAIYRKQTLYMLENNFLSAGRENVTFLTPAGRFGLLICADIYGGNIVGNYRAQGVDVLALSTSWAVMNSGMNAFVNGAIRGNAYVLAANQTYFPDSGVINPDGTKQSHIRQAGDAIAYGYLPLKTAGPEKKKPGPRRARR